MLYVTLHYARTLASVMECYNAMAAIFKAKHIRLYLSGGSRIQDFVNGGGA